MNSRTVTAMENQESPLTTDDDVANPGGAHDGAHAGSHKLGLSSVANDDDDDDDAVVCPICFQTQHLAVAPCRHVFCVPCLERILLGGSSPSTSPRQEIGEFVSADYPAGRDEDLENLKLPAWNACPMCRQSLFLWDVKQCCSVATKTTTSRHVAEKDGKESSSEHPAFTVGDYVYSRESPDFDQIPFLRSSVWLESTVSSVGSAGFGSFHFPPHKDEPELQQGYYNLQGVSGDKKKLLLMHDCLYHAESRVLSARLRPQDQDDDDDVTEASESPSSYRLLLAFSGDGSFVRSGALVVEQPALTPSRHTAQFPFDGLYEFQDEQIVVVGHKCLLNGQPLLLQKVVEVDEDYSESFGEDDDDLFPVALLKLLTPNRRVVATTACTTGVGVGAQLVWNIKGSLPGIRRTWKWHRLGGPTAVTDRLPRHKIHRWGGPNARRWLKRQGPPPPEAGSAMAGIPEFHGDSVWGNVFCQAFKVGLASYHFVPPSNGDENEATEAMGHVYISYENPLTSDWPPLDNGQPIPAKVRFHNISFPTPTTFRGEILWLEDYGTPWQGMIRWEYEMIFDEQFTCIVGGSVKSFEVHTPYVPRELSRYGESLVYVNAALYHEFRRLVVQEEEDVAAATQPPTSLEETRPFVVNQDWSDRYRSRSLELRLRLQHANAGVRTIAMVHRLLTMAYQGEAETCPIDYNTLHAATAADPTHVRQTAAANNGGNNGDNAGGDNNVSVD